ncbi:retinoid-inducible serine carboxypeptidase [Trichonephila clavipes]|nr:retinoid-inducible serine carboxypeptidase [Trichonephila clavipes]
MKIVVILLVFCFTCVTLAGPVEKKEAWGYVNVRKDAHMFWWLYYTDQTEDYTSYPLVIWLQGGPGSSSTGYGNFMEIGPLDVHLNPRNSTWLKKANLLFFDNPVGTGFSYVTNKSALARDNKQIAQDLTVALSSVLDTVPEFQKTPLYIFSESYGGKMTVDFALALTNAIKNKNITCNFKGIALGDSWISPLDSVYTWPNYLYMNSLLDKNEFTTVKNYAYKIKVSLMKGQFKEATAQFSEMQDLIGNLTNNVDWYNILKDEGPAGNKSVNKLFKSHPLFKMFGRLVGPFHSDPLSDLMNGKIRQKLNDIPKNVTWGGSSHRFHVWAFLTPLFQHFWQTLGHIPFCCNCFSIFLHYGGNSEYEKNAATIRFPTLLARLTLVGGGSSGMLQVMDWHFVSGSNW